MGSNIDRYLAIWQAAHPGSWKDPKTKELKKELKSLEDELRPFYKQDKTFWTSLDVEDTKVLGYTYADVKKTPEETKKLFRHRHKWSIRPKIDLGKWRPIAPIEMEPLDLSSAQVYVNHPEYLRPIPPPETQDRLEAGPKSTKSDVTKDTGDGRRNDLNNKTDHQEHSLEPKETKRREWFIDDVVERQVPTCVECNAGS